MPWIEREGLRERCGNMSCLILEASVVNSFVMRWWMAALKVASFFNSFRRELSSKEFMVGFRTFISSKCALALNGGV